MPITNAGPSAAYLILLGVVVALLVLVVGGVVLGVYLVGRRRQMRLRRERELAGNPQTRLDGVLAGLAADGPTVRGTAWSDDEDASPPARDVEQARFQVGGPDV